MKSVEKQSPAKIKQFELDTIARNQAIAMLVEDPMVPGLVVELTLSVKYHLLLFDLHLQDFLEKRGTGYTWWLR